MKQNILCENDTEPPPKDWEPPSPGEKHTPNQAEPYPGSCGWASAAPALKLVEPKAPAYHAGVNRFRKRYFSQATTAQWNDWQWQLRNRVTSVLGLSRFLNLSPQELLAGESLGRQLPVSVTPYYLSLLDPENPDDPLRRAVVPNVAEATLQAGEADDPLGEEQHMVAPGLVHRYPDRVLFLATGFCSTYCRYCTRSRLVGDHGGGHCYSRANLQKALEYIERTPAVRDVLISGGDPFTMSDERLEWIISQVRRIKHVELIRVGTKAPVVLPQRVTPALVRMLKRYHPLFVSIHFTHPAELTPEVQRACERLADAGIPLGSQTVLLKGINDEVGTVKDLMQGLLKMRVRPYYLYQCDPIRGSAHFRTTVSKGLEIIQGLRGHTTGYGVPTYVIDAPGGGGKVALYPDTVAGRNGSDLLLRNYAGDIYSYPDNGGGQGVLLS